MMTMRRMISGLTPDEIKSMKKEDLDLPITPKDFDEALGRCKRSVSDNGKVCVMSFVQGNCTLKLFRHFQM